MLQGVFQSQEPAVGTAVQPDAVVPECLAQCIDVGYPLFVGIGRGFIRASRTSKVHEHQVVFILQGQEGSNIRAAVTETGRTVQKVQRRVRRIAVPFVIARNTVDGYFHGESSLLRFPPDGD